MENKTDMETYEKEFGITHKEEESAESSLSSVSEEMLSKKPS
jgi:hypothetical protein